MSLPFRAEAKYPEGSTLWELDSSDVDDPNHALFAKIQFPESLEDEMLVRLIDKVLSSKFFDILRTQQQLGYIVVLGSGVSLKLPTLHMAVQTEFPPEHVRGCMKNFLEDHFGFVEESLKEEELQQCKDGLISELRQKPKNLGEEAGMDGTGF